MAATVTAIRSGADASDASLVVAARAGGRWACEALFRKHAPMVNRLAFRLMGRDADVDDLVQDSFTHALAGLARLQEPAAFSGWLASIVARNAYKTLRRRQLLRRLGLYGREQPIEVDHLHARGTPPDIAAELHAVYRALHRMPARVRVPLVLHRIEGMPLDSVATAIGMSVATVKRRIAEAEDFLNESAPVREKA